MSENGNGDIIVLLYSSSPSEEEMSRSNSVSGDDSLPSKQRNSQTQLDVDYNDYLVNSNKVTEKFDSREHELQHASDMSAESVSSVLRVDIADIDGGDSLNLTTTHLRLCKQQVLRPYWRLLMLIGWRGFGKENVNNTSCGWQVLNMIYPMFITILLLYTYIYEIVACQWKLDVRKDTQIITTSTTKIPNITTTSTAWPFMTVGPSFIGHKNHSDPNPASNDACEHIITTYVIPNFLHFVAFMMGLYHFRIQENEQLYALMEKVFLQATPLYSRSASQQTMIHKMRIFLAGGIVWVLMLLGMQALYEWAFDFPRLKFFVIVGPNIHWLLFSIEMLGILILNSVTVAVVANYITQCEMILFYVKGVSLRLQEKSTDLKAAMKDILSVRLNLSLLNGPIARMTGLVSVIFAELAIIGISILALNKNDLPKVWAYRSLFPFVWSIILIFPLMQAARVNSVCNRFKKIALEIRVFGYKTASQLELDSFLLFISNANLRAKLFHVPILPKYMIAVVVLLLFIILILLQTGIIGGSDLF